MSLYIWKGTTNGSWNTTTNWSPNGTPGTGDSIEFNGQSIASLTVGPSGTPRLATVRVRHSCPSSTYIFDPTASIPAIPVDSFIVGEDNTDGSSGSGSQQICWNFGATGSAYSGTTIRILKSNPTGLAGREAIQLKGTHASNKLYIEGSCNVGMGTSFPGDAYTLSQVNVTGAGGKLNLGSGGTLTTIYQSNGAIILNCAVTTINQIGGSLTTFGSGAITTANVSGVFNSESTGTITTLAVKGSGVADFSGSSLARTVTNASITGKGQINAKTGQALAITFTNAISVALDSDSSQVNFGGGVSVQQS